MCNNICSLFDTLAATITPRFYIGLLAYTDKNEKSSYRERLIKLQFVINSLGIEHFTELKYLIVKPLVVLVTLRFERIVYVA